VINKRNLICVKDKEQLELGELLLYEPYKNILINFKDLCININAKEFDPISKVYDGLLSVPEDIKEYYESLLGVTSYYQHSQGGKGKYIEKKLASSFETCSLNIKLSELPIWFEYPSIYRKKGIYTQDGLTKEEKSILRTSDWDWIGERDLSIDVGSIIKNENAIVLIEIKNRVDSGGTAGRREIWTSEKFGIFVDYLINPKKKLYRKNNNNFSFVELLENFKINIFELYIGVLFDKSDKPATIDTDKTHGFYSSSKQGYEYLKNIITKNKDINIIKNDPYNLLIEFQLNYSKLKVLIGALYGDEITEKLFRKKLPISKLLLLKYDDIWLSQLITIEERAILLKEKKNYTTFFLDLLKQDAILRKLYDDLIKSECSYIKLQDIIKYLLSNYKDHFHNSLLPFGKEKEEYLADIIQVLCACES